MSVWAWWLIVAGGLFLAFEIFALVTRKVPTLSATIWNLTKRYPIIAFGLGLGVGVLAVHFFGNGMCP